MGSAVIAMGNPLTVSLIALLLPLLCQASISRRSIDANYSLYAGVVPLCPRVFQIRNTPEILVASDLRINNSVTCTGGRISLVEEPTEFPPTNSLIKFFRDKSNIGDFISGFVEGAIECGDFNTARNVGYIVVVAPERDFTTTWKEMYDGVGTLVERVPTQPRLSDELQYLFLADKCLYRARKQKKACFPGSARVRSRDGWKRIDEIKTGDEVAVGGGQFSTVFGWTHSDPWASGSYVRIEAGGERIVLTEGHFVYTSVGILPAKEVRVGMAMKGEKGEMIAVEKVEPVQERGLYNPQTLHGDIVVDGFWVTTYTTAINIESAHAALAPVRAVWQAWGMIRGGIGMYS